MTAHLLTSWTNDTEGGGYQRMKGSSVLSDDGKVLLLTSVTMKVSALDLSSKFKKKRKKKKESRRWKSFHHTGPSQLRLATAAERPVRSSSSPRRWEKDKNQCSKSLRQQMEQMLCQ